MNLWTRLKSMGAIFSKSESLKMYEKIDRLAKELKALPENKGLADQLIAKARSIRIRLVIEDLEGTAYYSPNDKALHVSEDNLNAATLSHELGHAMCDMGLVGKLGKRSMKDYKRFQLNWDSNYIKLLYSIMGAAIAGGSAVASTIVTGTPIPGLALGSVALSIPYVLHGATLTQEGLATRTGLKLLKEFGASKAFLKKSEDLLGLCWDTYNVHTSGYRFTSASITYLLTSLGIMIFSDKNRNLNKSFGLFSAKKATSSDAILFKNNLDTEDGLDLLVTFYKQIYGIAYNQRSKYFKNLDGSNSNLKEFLNNIQLTKAFTLRDRKYGWVVQTYHKEKSPKFFEGMTTIKLTWNALDQWPVYIAVLTEK